MKRILLLVLLVVLLSGCSISRNIVQVRSDMLIDKVYVLKNNNVLMEGMNDELVTQFRQLGFESELYQGDRPSDATYYFTYTANWAWDMAMYLVYFRGTIYQEGKILGEVEYDAKMGGANMNKFGKTGEKIRPLLNELMAQVKRG